MKLPDKVYEFLKWLLLIVIPAAVTLLSGLGTVFEFDTTSITAVIGLVATFIGSCVGISTINYRRTLDEDSEDS